MQSAGTVTAFTADPVAVKDGRAIAVAGIFNGVSLIGVAEQTGRFDRPLGGIHVLKTRGQIPRIFLRIPAEGRLKEIAVTVQQIRPAAGARAEDEGNVGVDLDHDPAGQVAAPCLVQHRLRPPFDQELEPQSLEWSVGRRVVALQGTAGARGDKERLMGCWL